MSLCLSSRRGGQKKKKTRRNHCWCWKRFHYRVLRLFFSIHCVLFFLYIYHGLVHISFVIITGEELWRLYNLSMDRWGEGWASRTIGWSWKSIFYLVYSIRTWRRTFPTNHFIRTLIYRKHQLNSSFNYEKNPLQTSKLSSLINPLISSQGEENIPKIPPLPRLLKRCRCRNLLNPYINFTPWVFHHLEACLLPMQFDVMM